MTMAQKTWLKKFGIDFKLYGEADNGNEAFTDKMSLADRFQKLLNMGQLFP
jgi:hypothetical protein